MKVRKPIDLVEEMLSKGEHWSAILSVGRSVRNGAWAKEIVQILVEKNLLLPDNPEKALKQRDEIIQEQRGKEIRIKKLRKTPYLPITNPSKKKKAEAKTGAKTEAKVKTRVRVKVDLDTCQKAWQMRQEGMSWTKIEASLGMKSTKGMNAYRASKRWEKTK